MGGRSTRRARNVKGGSMVRGSRICTCKVEGGVVR